MILFCLFLCFEIFSSESLYGLGEWYLQLQSIDSKTGKLSPIGKNISTDTDAQGLSTIDVSGKVFYTITIEIDQTTKKYTVFLDGLDLDHGDLVTKIELPFVLEMEGRKRVPRHHHSQFSPPNFLGDSLTIDFDPKSGNLIVVGMKANDKKHHIVTVNPKTKEIKEIGVVSGYDNTLSSMSSALDFDNGVLHLMFLKEVSQMNGHEYMIVGYDVETGKVVKAMNNTKMMMTMDYDPTSKKIYGMGVIIAKQSRTLLSLDPSTYEFEVIKEYDDYFYLLGGISALNVKDRKYYSYCQKSGEVGIFRLLNIDLSDGTIGDEPQCTFAVNCPLTIESAN